MFPALGTGEARDWSLEPSLGLFTESDLCWESPDG